MILTASDFHVIEGTPKTNTNAKRSAVLVILSWVTTNFVFISVKMVARADDTVTPSQDAFSKTIFVKGGHSPTSSDFWIGNWAEDRQKIVTSANYSHLVQFILSPVPVVRIVDVITSPEINVLPKYDFSIRQRHTTFKLCDANSLLRRHKFVMTFSWDVSGFVRLFYILSKQFKKIAFFENFC